MKRIYVLVLSLLVLFPIRTKAIYEVIDSRCDNELKISLREEARDVTYRLTKVVNNDNVTYSLIFYNVSSNLYIADSNNRKYGDRVDNLKPGISFIINIYASNNNYCDGYKAGSKIISVPNYNKYSKSKLCNGYETYTLCKEDSNINLSEEEFEKKMKEYIDSLNRKKEEKNDVEEKNEFNLLDFLSEYGIYIIGGISIIGVIVAAAILENKRKNRGIL